MTNINWATRNIINKNIDKFGPWFPKSVNSRCPEIMLAVNRIDNVPDRITFLIVSITTINGVKNRGVPFGTKCENIWFVWFNQPKIMYDNHIDKENVSVNVKWLVDVKIYGTNPNKLLNKIIKNVAIKINLTP